MARRNSNTAIGRIGETLAGTELEARGYIVVERNWRCEAGEIDIVARDGVDWVFVEVKARHSQRYGIPEDSITASKRKRLLRCGLLYMASHSLEDANWRIDVVAIMLSANDTIGQIKVHCNAVRASGPI
jgi:putative endonuclease